MQLFSFSMLQLLFTLRLIALLFAHLLYKLLFEFGNHCSLSLLNGVALLFITASAVGISGRSMLLIRMSHLVAT